MQIVRKVLLNIVFVLSIFTLKAGVISDSSRFHTADTIKEAVVRNLRFDIDYAVPTLFVKDSTNEFLYRSLPYYKSTLYPGYLGVIGQAAYSLSYFDNKSIIDNPFLSPYSLCYFSKSDKVFYNTRRPFTIMQFVGSSSVLEYFNAIHTQNINKDWNIGIEMKFYGAEGAYVNQKSSTRSAKAFSTYFGPRYSIVAQYSVNRLFSKENGGVDSSYIITPEALSMKLLNASSVTRYSQLYIKQEFNLTGRFRKSDSIKVDINEFPICLGHELTFDKSYRSFKNDMSTKDSSFYQNLPFTKKSVIDSSFSKSIDNFVYLKSSSSKDKNNIQTLMAGYGIELEKYFFANYEMWRNNTKFYNSYIQANAWNLTKSHKGIDASARFYLPGRKESNVEAQARIYSDFKKFDSLRIEAKVSTELLSPSYFYTTYRSNHFTWNNGNLDKQQSLSATVQLYSLYDKYHLKANATVLNNFLYVSENLNITQDKSKILVYALDGGKQTNIGILYLSNNVVFQQSSSDVISIPQIVTANTIAIKAKFFKKALSMKTGFDIYYWTKFYAPAYMPELGVFYKQTKQKYGDHPFVDAFLQFNFKRMQVFFKYSHANYYLTSTNYFFSVDQYPLDKPAFSYGLSWYFYN